MSATPDSTLANPEQRIADLERQLVEREAELAECQAERDEAVQRETATAEACRSLTLHPATSPPCSTQSLRRRPGSARRFLERCRFGMASGFIGSGFEGYPPSLSKPCSRC